MIKSKNYILFLNKFIKKNYKFKTFTDNLSKINNVILRHDIDFDIDYALEIAKIEYSLGVKSNFFFLLTGNFYNITNNQNINKIKNIKKLGHQVGIHFDPSNYNDKGLIQALKNEKKIFEKILNIKVKVISIHRPHKKFLNNDKKIANLYHTYQLRFVSKNIEYYADSRNKFRYGNPINSEAFNNKKNLQILIHPIWWMNQFNNPTEKKIKYFIYKKKSDLIDDLNTQLFNTNLNFKT